MKIIVLGAFYHPSVGGVERQMEEIAVNLKEQGEDVKVFTTDATHTNEKRMQRYDEIRRGVPVKRFRYHLSLGYFFRTSFSLISQLFREDFDVIHTHNIHDGHTLLAILIKLIRRKKLVLTGHNPYMVAAEKRGDTLNWFVRFYDLVFRLFAGGVDHYIALLDSEKQAVQKKFGWRDYKISVIPNGIQQLYYQRQGDKEKFYEQWNINPNEWDLIVSTASRLNYVKGIQNLKTAVENLPNVLFIVAGGDDGYYDTLKRIYRNAQNIIFTEQYLTSEEVTDLLQASNIFLLPSVYEPFGMTIVEAMAQGRMVLATNNGGPPEIIHEKFGEILDAKNAQAWYERIKYYTEHKDEAHKKGKAARTFATKYQWPHVISQIREVYQQTANK